MTGTLPTVPLARGCPLRLPDDYAALRAQGPLVRARLRDSSPVWLVLGHAAVSALLADPRLSSDAAHPNHPEIALLLGQERTAPEVKRAVLTFIEMDGQEHLLQRRMVARYFSSRRIRDLRGQIQRHTDRLVDRMLADGPPVDLVRCLAVPLPAHVLCHLFGIPEHDRDFFCDVAVRPVLAKKTASAAFEVLADYFGRLLATDGPPLPDGILDGIRTAVDSGRLTHSQAVNMCMMLLVAGHETTTNTIALATLATLSSPGLVTTGCADVVDELLRYLAVADVIPRVAKTDVEVAGQTIRAGDGVVLSLGAANRDHEAFADADAIEPSRDSHRHLTFGLGVHRCLGHSLARTELEIALQTLFRRIPTLRLAVAPDQVPIIPPGGLHGVQELPVSWRTDV